MWLNMWFTRFLKVSVIYSPKPNAVNNVETANAKDPPLYVKIILICFRVNLIKIFCVTIKGENPILMRWTYSLVSKSDIMLLWGVIREEVKLKASHKF